MAQNETKNQNLMLKDVDFIFIYSFDIGHRIKLSEIKSVIKFGTLIDKDTLIPPDFSREYQNFIKYIKNLDKTYEYKLADEPVEYLRFIFPEESCTINGAQQKVITFCTLYNHGTGIVVTWLPLRGRYTIESIIKVSSKGLPIWPYSIAKKIPISVYKSEKKQNRLDFIAYSYIEKILNAIDEINIINLNESPRCDYIECYPYITIEAFEGEKISIDEFKVKYVKELWGILTGDIDYNYLRPETLSRYLQNIAIYRDRIAMPSEDGNIYVFGSEVNEVFEGTKKTFNSKVGNEFFETLNDFLEYRIFAYYLYTEFYRFEVFYLETLSWKLSWFLELKLSKSSRQEIIKYYYYFSKNLDHYYNFGEHLLLYLPSWNREVWKKLRENEVSDCYYHLKEGLKIIETTVQLFNTVKISMYAIIISVLIVLIGVFSQSEYSFLNKAFIAILTLIISAIIWYIINHHYSKQLRNLIEK